MHRILAFAFLAAFWAVAPLGASATPITVPSGLNPGDQYRLAFVTSATTQATSHDLIFYNNFVTMVANSNPTLAAMGTGWAAIARTAYSAIDNTNTDPSVPGYPIYNLAGNLVASSNHALWGTYGAHSTSLISPINIMETGEQTSITTVWTGTYPYGIGAGVDGSPTLGALDALLGNPQKTSSFWMNADLLVPTTGQHSMYALSDVLTVPTPEPSTFALAACGLTGLAAWAWRRKR